MRGGVEFKTWRTFGVSVICVACVGMRGVVDFKIRRTIGVSVICVACIGMRGGLTLIYGEPLRFW